MKLNDDWKRRIIRGIVSELKASADLHLGPADDRLYLPHGEWDREAVEEFIYEIAEWLELNHPLMGR